MIRPLPLLALALALVPAGASLPRSGGRIIPKTYLYTYYDKSGRLVVNNLPPTHVRGLGLTLKSVGVGQVRLAMSAVEMARVIKSPELIALVDEIAAAEGVDTFLARAIIQAESAFNYKARSHSGALGLMQLMPATAERFGVTDPFDPRQNISGGVKYLRWLHDFFKGDLEKVVAAYNAGEGAVTKHKGIPPFRETRAYVPKVIGLYRAKAVQPDPKAAGAMQLLATKGRGGFEVEEKTPPVQVAKANTRIYQWTDAQGRLQISDQPPPKGSGPVKVYGG
ncbi:MAG TPA: transglycosylase SLT domain-containing protein [Holophagaceae bacterium]|nr:transglycosylase SLT domain-containing protein [Holophagaceae bacterium]